MLSNFPSSLFIQTSVTILSIPDLKILISLLLILFYWYTFLLPWLTKQSLWNKLISLFVFYLKEKLCSWRKWVFFLFQNLKTPFCSKENVFIHFSVSKAAVTFLIFFLFFFLVFIFRIFFFHSKLRVASLDLFFRFRTSCEHVSKQIKTLFIPEEFLKNISPSRGIFAFCISEGIDF